MPASSVTKEEVKNQVMSGTLQSHFREDVREVLGERMDDMSDQTLDSLRQIWEKAFERAIRSNKEPLPDAELLATILQDDGLDQDPETTARILKLLRAHGKWNIRSPSKQRDHMWGVYPANVPVVCAAQGRDLEQTLLRSLRRIEKSLEPEVTPKDILGVS